MSSKRCIFSIITAATVLCFACARPSLAATVSTADEAAILAPVNAWARAFDTHQAAFPTAAFTDDCTVIDFFPPFSWAHGATNVHQWYARIAGMDSPAHRRRVLESHERVTIGEPENLTVQNGLAYMTFHSSWSALDQRGTWYSQRGLFTVVERKTSAGWRIIAHSWGVLGS